MKTTANTDIPVTRFIGTLRQITPESVNAEGMALLQACAPRFLALNENQINALFRKRKQSTDPNITGILINSRPHRRWSGDYFSDEEEEYRLNSGCYYSVSEESTGRDHGTLANELNAYRDPGKDYFCLFVDCFEPEAEKNFGLPKSAHVAVVVFHPDRLKRHLDLDAPAELIALVDRSINAGRPFGITLGCSVVNAELDGVLDLRQLEAQEWFLRTFVPKGPFHTNAKVFQDILPELLNLEYGGVGNSNYRLQAVGAILRKSGVKALIFPSARSDVSVRYERGHLVGWRGWNMVIYRAPPPREVTHIDPGGWETNFNFGIQCETQKTWLGKIKGWHVHGLHLINMLRYDNEMKRQGRV